MNNKDDRQARIPLDEAARGLEKGFSSLDPQRVAGLERLRKVRAAKLAVRGRERERLARRLGEDHPRVAAIAASEAGDRALIEELDVAVARARVETPEVDENGWALHGRVVDARRRGLTRLTVTLHDREGRWAEQLGHACTDADGYFRLVYRGGAGGGKQPDRKADFADVAALTAEGQEVELFARVHDAEGKLLHADPRPITPRPGAVEYIEIVIDGDEPPCPPPGGGTRPPGGETKPPDGETKPPGGERKPPGGERKPPGGEREPPGGGTKPPGTGGDEAPKPRPPKPRPQDPPEWIVRGRVTDSAGQPVQGLMVTAIDKDNRYDDHLGAALTDRDGGFRISFGHRDFRESGEVGPDLFVTVADADGALRYSSEREIRHDAGPDEVFEIRLPKNPDLRRG